LLRTAETYEQWALGTDDRNIRLALPDHKEVNVGRTPRADERHSDIDFALHDAFKRARRQLQDRTHRLQGQVKSHEAQPTGKVTRLEDDFGVLEAPDGHDVYFHRNSVVNGDFTKLNVGVRVSFAEEMGEKGPQASTVRLIAKHSLRA
jgi:cold shock CspA family protein